MLEWRALSQRLINGSINQWRRRLQAVVQENGGPMSTILLSLTLLFVAYVITDELFGGVYHMIIFKLSVCGSHVDRMWRHLSC